MKAKTNKDEKRGKGKMKNGAGSLRKPNENKPFQIYLKDKCYFMFLSLSTHTMNRQRLVITLAATAPNKLHQSTHDEFKRFPDLSSSSRFNGV